MAKKKKPNPRRVPMTNEERLRQEHARALTAAWSIFFTVLLDKEGYDLMRIKRVWQECEYLSESISAGRVNIADLRRVLIEEYGINLSD